MIDKGCSCAGIPPPPPSSPPYHPPTPYPFMTPRSLPLPGYHGGMIASIQGLLRAIESNTLLIEPTIGQQPTGIVYQVLVPAYTAARLGDRIGQQVLLLTIHFIESQGQGTTLVPRLAGFLNTDDRRFYELFTTCKGVGPKRALRAMALSTSQIAMAIADRDTAILQSLPEIGRRMAETIMATLSGKVDPFLTPLTPPTPPLSPPHTLPLASSTPSPSPASALTHQSTSADAQGPSDTTSANTGGSMVHDALTLLVQLGENRTQAMIWIDQIMRQSPRPKNAQEILTAVYRMKSSSAQ